MDPWSFHVDVTRLHKRENRKKAESSSEAQTDGQSLL